jgi:L-ascorbate metabolism protein UlaG (beta-lactamase superfamily)
MMDIAYFGYNAFIIETGTAKLVIDPGASLYLPDRFNPIIPPARCAGATHILVTHGDPDHHWHTDRVANDTGAMVICSADMVLGEGRAARMLGPRDRGLAFTLSLPRLRTVSVGQTIDAEGLQVTGYPGRHGPLPVKLGPFEFKLRAGPGKRLGHGEMVFDVKVGSFRIVVFGDTALIPGAWDAICGPDLALIPIGGDPTMTDDEAAGVIAAMCPRLVVPCHYDCPALFSRAYNPVDPGPFEASAIAAGSRCAALSPGESIQLEAAHAEGH